VTCSAEIIVRLGVFLPNWVGDVVMATPALRALRKHVAEDGALIGVMRPYVAEVLAGGRWFDHSIVYEKKSKAAASKRSRVSRQLHDAQLDAVLLLTNSLRTGWMAWRSGARERIGYAGNWRGALLTTKLFEPRRRGQKAGLPPIDSYLNLAYAAGAEWEPPRMELDTTQADEHAADAVWHRFALPCGERVVVLNSGGAFGGAKHWPAAHFAKLASRLADERGLTILVNCGPGERDIARAIVTQARHSRVAGLADVPELPIGLTKACIRRSRMLITTESGPRYFGIAFRKPVVTLFGPTDPQSTRTHYEREVCLSLDLECQPCWQRTCPLKHHRCMTELSVESVYSSVVALLDRSHLDFVAA
jgi:heptosyltransferase II